MFVSPPGRKHQPGRFAHTEVHAQKFVTKGVGVCGQSKKLTQRPLVTNFWHVPPYILAERSEGGETNI
jgi:hypothetical protein